MFPSVHSEPARPRKPASVSFIQAASFVPALATPALIVLMLQRLSDLIDARLRWNTVGLDMIEYGTTPMDLATTEFRIEFTVLIAVPAVLGLLALVAAIGLHRRRRWARILTAVRSGVLLLPLAAWAAGCTILVLAVAKPTAEDYYIGPIDPFTLNAVAGTAAFVAELLVLILACKRRTRQWAPKEHSRAPFAAGPLDPRPQTIARY
jgi:hypothetical protein